MRARTFWSVARHPWVRTIFKTRCTKSGRSRAVVRRLLLPTLTVARSVPALMSDAWFRTNTPSARSAGAGTSSTTTPAFGCCTTCFMIAGL
jgi:hypothetical protein